jgi:hypothetical protein
MDVRLLIALAVVAALLAPAVAGRAAPATDPAGSASPAPGGLDLSIRARALGVAPLPQPSDALGLEPMRPRTGAGTTRMPSATTEVAPGVYFSVMPSCGPEDEFRFPPRPVPVRRR